MNLSLSLAGPSMTAQHHNSSTLPQAQPSYIFRGHGAAIHSVQIARRNTRLIVGDADGWIVLWKLESKRPVAVWRAHDAAILGTAEWASDKIITHGRDNALRIWQLAITDEDHLSKVLPADAQGTHHPKPWLLHTLPVNTLNFCAFTMCHEPPQLGNGHYHTPGNQAGPSDSILVAVPARDDAKIEVYRFPDEKLLHIVPKVTVKDTGMTMALKLAYDRPSNNTILIAGYEGGITAVHILSPGLRNAKPQQVQIAQTIYLSQPHTQPILSLDVLPDAKMYYTSSADAIIAAHRVPDLPLTTDSKESEPSPTQVDQESETKLSTEEMQPAMTQTSDPQQHQPPPPQKATPEPPTEPITFSKQAVPSSATPTRSQATPKLSGLSSLLSTASTRTHAPSTNPPPQPLPPLAIQPPHKTTNTKHAGQQSLSIRSDGRLFVTGGWDSKIRIYSTKTLKEVAVLKWHKEGVYATAFGAVLNGSGRAESDSQDSAEQMDAGTGILRKAGGGGVTGLGKLQEKREHEIQAKHWVVAGAKDGKVSLWEVF